MWAKITFWIAKVPKYKIDSMIQQRKQTLTKNEFGRCQRVVEMLFISFFFRRSCRLACSVTTSRGERRKGLKKSSVHTDVYLPNPVQGKC